MANKANKIQYIAYDNWRQGLIDKFSASEISDNALAGIVNANILENGNIQKRLGYTVLGAEITASGLIQGLHYFGYQNQMLTVCTDSLYKFVVGSDSVWTSAGSGLTANKKTEFANALTYCWITNYSNVPKRYNGTTMTDSGTGTSPDNNRPLRAQYTQFHQNRLFYGKVRETDGSYYESRYRYSGLRAIEGVDAWDVDAYFDAEADDGDKISGIRKYRNSLAIAKDNSLHILKGTSALDFGQFTYDTINGCVANRTMREVEESLLFLTRNGVFVFDGMIIRPFSENIKTTFDALTQSVLHNACGIYFDNKYIVSFPGDNKVLSYDTLSKSWTTYTNIRAIDFAVYTPSANAQRLYFGASNVRYVYRLFSGNNDNGSHISANFTTKKYDQGSPHIKHQYHQLWCFADGHASDSFAVSFRLDDTTAWTSLGTFTLSNEYKKFNFPAGSVGRRIQFKAENTSSYSVWTFKKFILSYEDVREAA